MERGHATCTTSLSLLAQSETNLDRFYTPSDLAGRLVQRCSVQEVNFIADFAAGDGGLLAACRSRWPAARIFANDLDPAAVRRLRVAGIADVVTKTDFLGQSRAMPRSLPRGGVDFVILNPPFGLVKGSRFTYTEGREKHRCSRAYAFLLKAVSLLRASGQVLAVMPSSSIKSEIDSRARRYLLSLCKVEIVEGPTTGLFAEADASIYVLRATRRNEERSLPPTSSSRAASSLVIQRGTLSVRRNQRKLSKTSVGWVHTSNTHGNEVVSRYSFPLHGARTKCAPGAVLIPRVGKFDAGKVVLLDKHTSEVISDCYFSVTTGSYDINARLFKLVVESKSLPKMYVGTGAGYVTVRSLTAALAELLAP